MSNKQGGVFTSLQDYLKQFKIKCGQQLAVALILLKYKTAARGEQDPEGLFLQVQDNALHTGLQAFLKI